MFCLIILAVFGALAYEVSAWYDEDMEVFTPQVIATLIFITAWQLFWKGIALWRAAASHQKKWFIALVILIPLNDLGLVPIVYLFFFAKHPLTLAEMTKWLKISKHR